MEQLIEATRNIVLIIFFASVFEMILPKSSLGKFVQLIMGLFIIITILTPIMNLSTENFELKILTLSKAERSLVDQGFKKGLNLQAESQVLAKGTVIANLERQIAAIANLVPGVVAVEVEVIPDQDFVKTGRIDKIYIQVKPKNDEEGSVKIVKISNSSENRDILTKFPEETAQNIRETVASFFGFDTRIIEILAREEEERP